ncbi:titin homolog [Cyclopterus lumpus]|uniref:titin homolog n=1 Tax=Cyclopterus lumpus TaxID=8103 RepID=UPI001485DCB9|nr:titin homolog [Cyclopterus lumpus]XP_034399968.1 titin homolog [Cyclopterus lumpus]
MLNPTRAQKNLSEEDSSGSDAGSEGQEPETDRFGFILTNGSTAGSLGPPPELVRQRETKWIHIMSQWDRILLKKTSKVKVQCQKGIPASLRAKCWPLLCGATDKTKQNENLYQSLDSQPALQSWVDVIERDLDRQFPFHEMFLSKDGHGQQGLFRVLKAFTQYQPEEGYCQAQGPVAAVLLMNMPAEEAFWCLVQISEQYLPGYYSPLLEGVLFDAAMLNWALKRTCPAAHKHLQHHGVEPLMFATDWLMCLFTRHLPFNTLLRVWDLFFCYGVRVLLQVAVVLVRRVLGRAEQRKLCQGQMETLEKLRAVMEQVQEEDDTFIAEVCSVQLSARDLEKQTEKELEKWRKDRPSSTFDPRGRCHGYRMAWARARQYEEVRGRKEREKGNLSVPLARSASTLSLSPSLLHKRWRKGGKANSRKWEGSGGKVVRHLSMGAKEDWRGWTEFNSKKVQRVHEEEDVVLEDHKNVSELKLTEQILLEEPKTMEIPNMPTVEETVIVEEENDQVETRITEKEESQLNKTEESRVLSEQKEETNEKTQQTKDQTVEHKQGEELDSNSQTQVLEQQSHTIKHLEIQGKDSNKETENEVAESENTNAVVENQTEIEEAADPAKNTKMETQESVYLGEYQMIEADMKPESTETVQQTQVDTVTTETRPGSETDSKVKAPTIKHPTTETETQQQKVITETDRSSRGDAFEEKYHSSESLAETETQEESHTQTETETNELAQTQEQLEENAATQESESEIVQMNSEQHIDSETEAETFILCSPQCIQPEEGDDLEADTETEAEIPFANDIVTESTAGIGKEGDAAASEPTQEEEERRLDEHSEAQVDQTQAEETPTEMETSNLMAPPQEEEEEEDVTQDARPQAGPDGETSSVETEEPAPEQPPTQVTIGAVEEEESTETVQENTVGEDDVLISTEPTDSPNTDRNREVQDKDSRHVTDKAEPVNDSLTQAPGHRSSRSSGNLCVRRSSNSRGSRLARRLSEDLFIMSDKTNQSQSTPNHPVVNPSQLQPNPGEVNPTQSPSDVTSEVSSPPSAEVTPAVQPRPDPPKRFGLFRRLRGEQAKKSTKMQIPKILIQDYSDGTGKPVEEDGEEKLSSKERRRRRRDRERKEKEEERLKKKREKELGKEKERERTKPQTRGQSFQLQREKGSSDVTQPETGSQTLRYSSCYAESYF